MKLNRLGAALCCLALLWGLMAVPVSAAGVEPGVYTASMVTSYYNPDTGNVDDGGTANAALGEGMCRSATDKTALVEVDKDGSVWVTVRLLLQSNCSNIALYTRSGYDSYKQVNYNVIAEDAANDSIDYRIKVSEPGQKLKCTMYVSPMGRDVLWYLYVDTSTLKAGSGDFVASIDTSVSTAAETLTQSQTPAKAESAPATDGQPSQETPGQENDGQENENEFPDDASEEGEGMTEGEEMAEDGDLKEGEEPEESDSADSKGSTGMSGGLIAGIVVVAVVVVGVVIYFVRRRI